MNQKILFALSLIGIATITRFIPHPVNFTPVLAIGLFSGFAFSKKWAWAPVVASMFLADLFLGFHGSSLFVYAAVALLPLIAILVKKQNFALAATSGSLISATAFYLVTNFGTWLMTPMYSKTMAGLMQSYVAGIPFFRNSLTSTFIYSIVMIGALKAFESYAVKTQTV